VETLISFLKYSSPLDWFLMVLWLGIILFGLLLLIVSRARKLFYGYLFLALLPLPLGLATTYLKYLEVARMSVVAEYAGPEVVAAGRREAWVITYIGATASGAAILIGLSGLALKKGGKT
jgi:hypothetical protein